MKSKRIISAVIMTQLVVVGVLGFQIYQKKTQVLGQVSMMPLPKDSVVMAPTEDLKHFYELAQNTSQDDPRIPIAASYTINADTLNERHDYATEKPADTFRIVALGDSFTYGAYVDTPDNWTEKLEDTLGNNCQAKKNYEVINLGVPGYDIQYAAQRYAIRGEKYNPDLIMWLLKDDDFELINKLFQPLATAYENELRKEGVYDQYVQEGNYSPGWKKAGQELYNIYSQQELYEMSSVYLQEFIASYHRPLLLVTLASVTDTTRGAIEIALVTSNVRAYEISTNIYSNKSLYYENDWHPTAKGHEVIAEDLYKHLVSSSLIPCN